MMKKIIILLLMAILFSCYSTKQVICPNIKFKIFDHDTKKPLSEVTLFTNDSRDNVEVLKEYSIKSNKNGIINFEEISLKLEGNIRNFMPIVNTEFHLKKVGYDDYKIKLFEYFKINEQSRLNKTYISDSIFLKKKK
jgi:hypothetical protein